LLTISGPIPSHFLYPYGVTAALVALASHDKKIREKAISALIALPPATVESNKDIQTYLAALRDDGSHEQMEYSQRT
jgi:hypothetical protein